MSLRPPWVTILLALALVGGAVAYLRERDARIRASAVASERIAVDSAISARLGLFLEELDDKLDARSDTVERVIERWQTRPSALPAVDPAATRDQLLEVLRVRDSIHAATVFAGDEVARECSIFRGECNVFRDSAQRRFVADSGQIANYRTLYESSRQRRCGLGGAIGLGATYQMLPDTATRGTIAVGPSLSLGVDCRF